MSSGEFREEDSGRFFLAFFNWNTNSFGTSLHFKVSLELLLPLFVYKRPLPTELIGKIIKYSEILQTVF